jgi:hypothetical protein
MDRVEEARMGRHGSRLHLLATRSGLRFVLSATPAVLLGAALFVPGAPAARAQETAPAPSTTTTAPALTGPLVDATLDSMQGGSRTLSAERGHRAVVLFYEDRPHVEDNDGVKGEIGRFVHDNHLDDRIVIYGVANLGDVGMVPETLVRQMIQPLVERWGADILLDWHGVMRQAPFSLATHAANVAVIDRTGHLVHQYTGTIEGDSRRAFYRAIRAVVAI